MFKKRKTSSKEDAPKMGKKLCAKYIPIINWFPKYTKFQAFSDVIAGITLGLTMIPQSIAYAALAGLSAQVIFSIIFNLKFQFSMFIS